MGLTVIDPYEQRRRPRLKAQQGETPLRKQNRGGDGCMLPVAKGGMGDVKDSYLTGHAGGEAHPYFDKNKPKR